MATTDFSLIKELAGITRDLAGQDKNLLKGLSLLNDRITLMQGTIDELTAKAGEHKVVMDWIKLKMDQERADRISEQLKG